METWREIAKALNYEVSCLGRVRRSKPGKRTRVGLIRKPFVKRNGKCLLVSLRLQNGPKAFLVHRLVMEAFVGPSSLQVNHKNGNQQDNRLENLEYVDGAANRAHAMYVLNAYSKGSRHPNAKLTEADVIQIKEMIAAGILDRDIAPVFGCTSTNIYYIRKGKAWTHV